jgi:hypothetical protein
MACAIAPPIVPPAFVTYHETDAPVWGTGTHRATNEVHGREWREVSKELVRVHQHLAERAGNLTGRVPNATTDARFTYDSLPLSPGLQVRVRFVNAGQLEVMPYDIDLDLDLEG